MHELININQGEPDYSQRVLADTEIDWDKLGVLPEPHMSTRTTNRETGASETASTSPPPPPPLAQADLDFASDLVEMSTAPSPPPSPSPVRPTRARRFARTAQNEPGPSQNDETNGGTELTHTPRPQKGKKRQSAGAKGAPRQGKRKK